MSVEAINVLKRGIGVNFQDPNDTSVVVWAPEKQKVEMWINEQEKVLLKKQQWGYWSADINSLQPGDRYKFILDDEGSFPDPASLSQPDGPHGDSEMVDISAYSWSDAQWQNIPLEKYIIYELHTGTFSPEGTFEGIEKKLDHLLDLGVTAIEIMPIAQFAGPRNWGYDGVYPFAVQNTYGGADAFKRLVDICHAKGLAVILDVVYNHLGPEGNYLAKFGPYFTDKYHTPWGNAINFDDAWCDGVRRYFIENVLMWFRDFHIDALRMDAVHAIKDFSPTHILEEMKRYVNQLMEQTGRTHYLVVECDLNDTKFIDPLEKRGYGMDAQWIDEFHHSLRVTTGQERQGYYADFKGIQHLAKAYTSGYVYDGTYSEHRKKTFGNKADKNAGKQFVVFSQNHDQVGNRMLGERTSQLVSFEMRKLIAAAVMVSPYIPLLFMGEEFSAPDPFQYFVSHTDPELVEAVRRGRKAEFKEFHDTGEAPDPQAEETFQRSKIRWELLSQPPHSVMFQYYKTLISLRKTNSVLSKPDKDNIEVSINGAAKTLILRRWNAAENLICMMNFSQQRQPLNPGRPYSMLEKIFDSASAEWDGPFDAPDSISQGAEVIVQPESILIYSAHHV